MRDIPVSASAQAPSSSNPIKSSPPEKFADETSAQRARHLEIEFAQRRRRRKRQRPKFPNLRKHEMEAIFAERYGSALPDDDAGRDDLRLMADHLAQIGAHHVIAWARAWAPWAGDDELDALIETVGPGKNWKADALGKALGLDDATRTRLKIKTIGAADRSKAQRAKRRRKRRAAADAARRAKAGAVPRAMSAARTKPWEALGISRRTYYRNWANGIDGTNSRPILLESQLAAKQCHGGPPPLGGGSEARAVREPCRIAPSSKIIESKTESPVPSLAAFCNDAIAQNGNGARRPANPPRKPREIAMTSRGFDEDQHFNRYFEVVRWAHRRHDDRPSVRIAIWRAMTQSADPRQARALIIDAVMALREQSRPDDIETLAEFIKGGS